MINETAMIALTALRNTTMELNKVNEQIATGNRINQAADNAAYWSVLAEIRSDASAYRTVKDGLSAGQGLFDITNTAITSIRGSLEEIRDLLTGALQQGVDRANVGTQVSGLIDDIETIATSATYNGQNLLVFDPATDPTTFSFVSGFADDGSAVDTIDFDATNSILFDTATDTGILDTTYTVPSSGTLAVEAIAITGASTDADVVDAISAVEQAISATLTAEVQVGVTLSRVESQRSFVDALAAANDRAATLLAEADLEEASTKLRALQTQQQLTLEALSVANATSQNVIALFR